MRLRTPLTLAALLVLTCSAARAQDEPRQNNERVIDDFVLSRGVSFEEPGRKKQRQGTPSRPQGGNKAPSGKSPGGVASNKSPRKLKPVKGALDAKSGQGGGSEVAAQPEAGGGAEFVNAGGAARPLALGYTILMKDETGRLYVADPRHEFKTGDRFAVALETNADGYLYLFSAENGRDPELLFPNAQIEAGANAVQAHARATFPTGPASDVEYFIDVTDPPAAEHLFIVFSRRPLADVPAGQALVKFCGKNPEDCAWKPTAAQWARILDGAKGGRVTEAKSRQLAQAGPPPALPGTLQRGLKVRKEDPKPAIVRVNESPDADLLVTEIVLTHK
ncbi:MAG TPA: DUF4384 domain-containing protein [Pyrinomonadaceae bacterium]|jgi:hypothetical protein